MKRLCLAAAAFGGHVVSIVEERGEEWAGEEERRGDTAAARLCSLT